MKKKTKTTNTIEDDSRILNSQINKEKIFISYTERHFEVLNVVMSIVGAVEEVLQPDDFDSEDQAIR